MIGKAAAFFLLTATLPAQILTLVGEHSVSAIAFSSIEATPLPEKPRQIRVHTILENLSPRTVIGFDYSIQVLFADGTTRETGRETHDDIATLLMVPDSKDLFRPSNKKTIDTTIGPFPDDSAPSSITVTVAAAILDDDTLLGDVARIPEFQRGRKREVEWETTILGDLKDVKSSSAPKQRATELAAKAQKEDPGFGGRIMAMKMVAMQLNTNGEAVDKYISMIEPLVSGLQKHLTISPAK